MVSYFDLSTNRYPISCKLYLPEETAAKGVILGVHGFAGDKESSALAILAEATNRQGVALLCFDFPAHGASVATEQELTIENCMRDILFMADYIRTTFPTVDRRIFATSFGGYAALLCADQLTDFNIVLRAPAVTMPEHILMDILNTTPDDFKQRGFIECGYERKIKLPYSFYEELQRHRVMGGEYQQPMLIVHGDRDAVVPRTDIRQFCSNHPTMRLVSIDGADHRFKNEGEMEKVISAAMCFWSEKNGL